MFVGAGVGTRSEGGDVPLGTVGAASRVGVSVGSRFGVGAGDGGVPLATAFFSVTGGGSFGVVGCAELALVWMGSFCLHIFFSDSRVSSDTLRMR